MLTIIRGVTTDPDAFDPGRVACDLHHIGRKASEHDESWLCGGNTPAATGNPISAGFSPAGGGYIVIWES